MLIVIKGAGDLATGIACRLHRCGFQIVCTDIEKPTTVRCTVAFSRAVYDGAATVTGVTARLAKDAGEAREILTKGEIPVLIDPEYKEAKKLKPAVLVDAIIAKRNIGTGITDAPLVVGIGPGFTSGVDCHFCVESNRGHDMGRTLYEGSPEPDTATPGNVGGFSGERIIRATADGIWHPAVKITDVVEKGQLVAYAGTEPVYARMSGMVRGMLPEGTPVTKGLKSGDIDARCKLENCFTPSDKANAIAGGILEGVLYYTKLLEGK